MRRQNLDTTEDESGHFVPFSAHLFRAGKGFPAVGLNLWPEQDEPNTFQFLSALLRPNKCFSYLMIKLEKPFVQSKN